MSQKIIDLFAAGTPQAICAGVLFLIGLVLIVKGGDLFVDAASWMAEASGIPKFIVGATIVSVATTLPEMIVSFLAAAGAQNAANAVAANGVSMAIGNAIGSVTANTGLIMAISIVFMPIAIKRSQIAAKSALMLAAIAALFLLCLPGELSLVGSFAVLALFILFIIENLVSASRNKETADRPEVTGKILAKNIVLFILGAGMLALGSNLLVDNGEFLAVDVFGVDVRIVAITLVAIGTSLPELVTAVTSLVKKQSTMSVGNIIGANIIDMTIILPVCALISGGSLPVERTTCYIDMPICFLEAAIALIPTLISKKFRRWQGIAMLAIYVAYIVYSVIATA